MSITSRTSAAAGRMRNGASTGTRKKPLLHRIAAVRKRQGMSLRSVARQMHVEMRQLRSEEEESADLLLSTLYQWQQVLDVPVSELLVESNDPLSTPVMQRARLVKMMKTVAAIMERSDSEPIKRLAQMLYNQLVEIMPELKDISPWHSVGQRRTMDEYGRIVERTISDDMFFG